MSSLSPGNGRYGLMLSEDGLIFDDGVAFRVDENRWLISTSSGHSEGVNHHRRRILAFDGQSGTVKFTALPNSWNKETICGPKPRI